MNNAEGRFRPIAGVLVLLTRKNTKGVTEYLLQKRQNTGFADGMWDFSACGHLENGESLSETARRETKEEIGVDVTADDIEFIGLLHSFSDNESRLLGCFKINNYSGEIKTGEPERVAELRWFSENEIPEDLIDTRKLVLERFRNDGFFYQEYGW